VFAHATNVMPRRALHSQSDRIRISASTSIVGRLGPSWCRTRTPHCCVINTKPLVLNWLEAAVVRRLMRGKGEESYGFIQTVAERKEGCPNLFPPALPIWCHGTKDAWGGENWSVSTANAARRQQPFEGMQPSGWLPTREFAKLWLAFVTERWTPLPWGLDRTAETSPIGE
jgi:hypothetical protein